MGVLAPSQGLLSYWGMICNLARSGLCSGGFCDSISAALKEVNHGNQGYGTRCPGPDSRHTAPDAHRPHTRRNSSSTQPDTNSIAWLTWHLTRVQDNGISGLFDQEQAWISQGWHAKFGMEPDPDNEGQGHTSASGCLSCLLSPAPAGLS